ncbi:MAG: hypothetical protein AAGB46_08565 [Verrucomicrobiota bacterium]
MNRNSSKEIDYGNCGVVRLRGKEAYVKETSLRTVPRTQPDSEAKNNGI